MQEYYNVTTNVKDYLINHAQVNTVICGNISDVDIQRQTIYPLAQIIVGDSTFANNTIKFSMSVMVMDSVYVSKEEPNDLNDKYEGLDNKSDVYNSTLAVINGLQMNLRRGRLYKEHYVLEGDATASPFEDSFGNLLTGWRLDFTVVMPNVTVSTCAEYQIGVPIADTRIYTWDTTNVTFDNDN